MITRKSNLIIIAILVIAVLALSQPGNAIDGESYGVYQYVVRQAEGSIDGISTAIGEAAVNSGWRVAGTVDSGDPDKCNFKSRVIVLYHAKYADVIIGANIETGPYASLDRINIFEDEEGTHVSVVNPNSINRTILMDDTSYREISEKHLQDLRAMILSVISGTESDAQYGEFRTKGYIGKTMGVVAGGDFQKLIKHKYRVKEGGITAVGQAIGMGFRDKTTKWGLEHVYEVFIASHNIYVIGVSGSPMATKSFQIVKGGRNEQRKEFACPGLSHAAAFPLEIVVHKDDDGQIRIAIVDAMYRMKIYFEDAGTTAFMKNMKMPGSIDKEITKHIMKSFE